MKRQMKIFYLEKLSRRLICPDATVIVQEDTGAEDQGSNGEETYAEWKDIGLFYYPQQKSHWFQGQTPTYNGETLNWRDGIKLIMFERVKLQKEDLVMYVFHPNRLERMIERYGEDWMDNV